MIIVLLLLLIFPITANATTYWVSPSGGASLCTDVDGDTDPGAYLTIYQINSLNCAGSGDTVMFKSGTYTGAAMKFNLLFTANGTPSAMNKILCEGNRTCDLRISQTFDYIVFLEDVSHTVFGQEGFGFKVTCNPGVSSPPYDACAAYGLRLSATNAIYTNNLAEGNYFTGCTKTCWSMAERQPLAYYTHTTVRKNKIDALLANLSTEGDPHPTYCSGDGCLLEYNDIAVTFGFALHDYHMCYNSIWRYNKITQGPGAGSGWICNDNEQQRPNTNAQVYGNTFKWLGASNAGACLLMGNGSKQQKIFNNICEGHNIFVRTNTTTTATAEFKNNVCINGNCIYQVCTNSGSCTTTTTPTRLDCGGASPGLSCQANNPVITSPASHFRDIANHDYSLISTSSLINAGLDVSAVRPCNGTCDIGAHETFAPTAASIDSSFIDITLGMGSNTPPQFVSGTTGWSVGCSGTGCGTPTVSAVSLLSGSTSVVRLTVSGITGGACAIGQTWTWSFNSSTGTVTDSMKIGNTTSQRMFTYTSQPVTNSCGSGPPTGPGTPHIYYKFDEGTGTNANDESANNLDGTLTGGATWTAGRQGSGVSLTQQSGQYVAVPYGLNVDPTVTSLTIAFGVQILPGSETLNRSYFGSTFTTNRHLWTLTSNGSWCIGIQSSTTGACATALAVVPGWNRVCIRMDKDTPGSGTGTATLYINGQLGTGAEATKTYTTYQIASNFQLGRIANLATGGGGVYDEFKVWTSAESCVDDYEEWEPTAPPATGTYSQVAHQWQEPFKNSGGTTNDYAGLSATVPVSVGGLVSLVTQIDCTIADCQSVGVKLWYSRNGGAEQLVPDNFTSDQVKYAGSVPSDVFVGAATCCLTGALTENHGLTQITSAAEIFDIGQDASYTRRSVLRFGATASGTYCFKERDQNGLELSGTYTPSAGACVVIEDQSAGSGF